MRLHGAKVASQKSEAASLIGILGVSSVSSLLQYLLIMDRTINEPGSQNSEPDFAVGTTLGTAKLINELNFAIRELRFMNNEI
ncbi:hypothetical protein GCM10010918_34500 [Paenibacillus radicis (ex Gao et al. 2016)]|uniref:Uncharacterized protein n=1 Tax=Paenibacillus radicis (ex Gao et al. 2016) TaxID=1737354 RepID=A0A917HDS1_9BACL|nr:hypothetical protein GCM10010918_34500 [Paenibacillus radicis (ex Gao et al. 2016)]